VSKAGSILDSHVLLVPHHAGRTSSSVSFLQKVAPRICIISSGSGNPFGFPHKETIQRLEAIGCNTIRIDKEGAIEISLGPGGIQIGSFLE
jgi:competence protein ComEC